MEKGGEGVVGRPVGQLLNKEKEGKDQFDILHTYITVTEETLLAFPPPPRFLKYTSVASSSLLSPAACPDWPGNVELNSHH